MLRPSSSWLVPASEREGEIEGGEGEREETLMPMTGAFGASSTKPSVMGYAPANSFPEIHKDPKRVFCNRKTPPKREETRQ
eukprot:904898-Rhodomonas_salina.1